MIRWRQSDRIFAQRRVVSLDFVLSMIGVAIVLLALSEWNYLAFHVLAEGWSVFVAMGIFVIAGYPRTFTEGSPYSRFLGIAYLFIAVIDIFHVLTYKGMGVFPGLSVDIPTQLWVIARWLQAVALLLVPFLASRRLNHITCTGVFIFLAVMLVWMVYPGRLFPVCFTEGKGLTSFKIGSELGICALLTWACAMFRLRKEDLGQEVARGMITCAVCMIISELLFTFYNDVYGITNVIGHVFKALSFYYVFRVILSRGLEEPIQRRIVAEREAVRREQQIRVLIEGTRQALWEWNLQTDALTLDSNWFTVSGIRPEELGGTMETALTRIHPDDVKSVKAEVEAHFRKETPFFLCQFRMQGRDGHWQWFLSRGMVVERDVAGRSSRVVAICEDITERRREEEETRQLRDELAHAMRVNTMGQLAASIAHELNQPLAAIRANAQAALRFLTEEKPDMGEIDEILEDIIQDDRRAAEVIAGMRAMLQKKTGDRVKVNINAVLTEMTDMLYSDLAAKHVSVLLLLQSPLPVVVGDRVQLQQVLLNLIMNAVDAMNSPDVPLAQRELTVGTRLPSSDLIEVYVQDRGVGMDDALMNEVFKPFFTTKGHGLGMGLVITRRLVEGHGGTLWATRNDGAGVTFHFTLAAEKEDGKDLDAGRAGS